VAGQAFRVVIRDIPDNILMRIMACHATDAGIGTVEAFAVGQPVRLKAHVGLALPVGTHHSFPATVTLAAEV
jgi:hypothetical protein